MMVLPNTTKMKVRLRCQDGQAVMQGSSCIVYISIGQPYHEKEKFLATMDLVNRTFSACHIVVCDTLQRHTLRILSPHLTKQEAYRQAF